MFGTRSIRILRILLSLIEAANSRTRTDKSARFIVFRIETEPPRSRAPPPPLPPRGEKPGISREPEVRHAGAIVRELPVDGYQIADTHVEDKVRARFGDLTDPNLLVRSNYHWIGWGCWFPDWHWKASQQTITVMPFTRVIFAISSVDPPQRKFSPEEFRSVESTPGCCPRSVSIVTWFSLLHSIKIIDQIIALPIS